MSKDRCHAEETYSARISASQLGVILKAHDEGKAAEICGRLAALRAKPDYQDSVHDALWINGYQVAQGEAIGIVKEVLEG